MTESVGNSSNVTPNSSDMKSMLTAMRIYEELGSKRECQALIDNAPKLVYENIVNLRLHKKDARERVCKVYIFDDYFVVASERRVVKRESTGQDGGSAVLTTASSSDSGVVWFGSNKQSDDGNSENSKNEAPQPVEDYDSDVSYAEFEGQIAYEAEQEEIRRKRKYNLKMWVDLGKVKPRVTRLGNLYCVSIVYVSKVQEEVHTGEYRYNTVVDSAEIYIEDEATAKMICGLIQEAVNKKARELLIQINKQRLAEEKQRQLSMKTDASLVDTDTDNNSNGPQVEDLGSSGKKLSTKSGSTNNSRRRRREKFKQGKLAYQATAASLAMTPEERKKAPQIALTIKDVQKKYRVFDETFQTEEQGTAEEDEGKEAEFVVHFKNSKLGLALSSGKNIEPFVCQLEKHGLAEQSGVQLADRVIIINDTEITTKHDYKDVIRILSQYKKESKEITITFRRKQKAEIARLRKEEAERQALEDQLLLEVQKNAEKAEQEQDGAVTPVEDNQIIGRSDIRREESIEFRRKTDDGTNIPKFTLKRKSKRKKNWKRKKEILDNMKHVNVGVKEFKEFRKNKKRMFELFEQIEDLFHTVLDYSDSKEEKSCIYALKEVYDTEYKYNADLNSLRGMHMSLLTAQKQVACKYVKSGKPFCEHRRPRRYCNQASSVRENAIEHKVVNSIFLNLKPIIKSNQYLWKNLQNELGLLYKKAEQGHKVEVFDMLNVFCKVFIEIAPFLAIYWSYCQRYTDANEKQRILRGDNKYFREVIRPIEKKVGTKLPNLMAKPVQRISRYHLLFEALKKQAGKYQKLQESKGASQAMLDSLRKSNTDLNEAHGKLLALAQKVNSMVGEAAELDKILDIYQEIGGKDKVQNLIAPHRRFMGKQEVSFEHQSDDIAEPYSFLYLFNDKIVVAVQRQTTIIQGSGSKSSKYSYPIRAFMNTSNTRASSITKSQKKLSMESVPTEKVSKRVSRKTSKTKKKSDLRKQATLKKKLSMRLSNGRGNQSSVRLSTTSNTSKGSKGEEITYDILFEMPMREVNSVSNISKQVEDTDIPGVQVMYSKKHSEGSETTRFVLWLECPDERNKLAATFENLVLKDREKRDELKRIRDKKLGKKKRRFAKKLAKNKKQSVRAAVKSKSSLFSTTSHGARRAAAGITAGNTTQS